MEHELPQMLIPGCEIHDDLALAERREWWLTNGRGAYAGGTVAGTTTRRYHGLLIAPLHTALDRHLLFARADADLLDEGRSLPLHTNRWGSGAVEPRGYLNIESFRLDGRMPVWHYRLDDLLIEARIWMEQGRHVTYLAWRLLENPQGRELSLRVRLMVNAHDHHGATGHDAPPPFVAGDDRGIDVRYPDSHVLRFRSCCGVVEHAQYWVEDFDLPVESARGLPDRDRHWCAGHMTFSVEHGHWVGLSAAIGEDEPACYMEDAMRRFQMHDSAVLRHTKVVAPEFSQAPDWLDRLVLAADGFLVHLDGGVTQGRDTLVAGYPWFGEWGRDSMIAFPGLLLATGRYRQARELLLGYLPLVDRGMLPNHFPGDGETPSYNTVDAALWYIEAWCAYFLGVKDFASIAQAWPVLQQIVAHYRDGTRHGIHMDTADGLLYAGEPGVQLTWMDAKVGEHVVTPRIGKPVEVNALWYNALQTMAQFARALKDEAQAGEYVRMAAETREGFQRFVRGDGQGLYDVLDGPDGDDAAIRPNQILAVSLPHSALTHEVQRQVVACCREHLLTPCGLRSLAPSDPRYCARYEGDVWSRDTAYHQGTVWAWLLGHYALAEYRADGDAGTALARLEPIGAHLDDAGLGTVSEIFDGDPPHTPRGCPAQAWSVGCILEAYWKLRRAQHEREQT